MHALLLAVVVLTLRSADFGAGATIPQELMARGCGGDNRAPSLSWTNAPEGTKSFALLMHDADAPIAGGFYHWVLYDLPPTQHTFGGDTPGVGRLGIVSTGKAEYYGPCPPPGSEHHYTFTLYALDEARAGGDAPLDGAHLESAIAGHILAKATLGAKASTP